MHQPDKLLCSAVGKPSYRMVFMVVLSHEERTYNIIILLLGTIVHTTIQSLFKITTAFIRNRPNR